MSCDFQLRSYLGQLPFVGPLKSLCVCCWSPIAHWSIPHCGDSVNWPLWRPLLTQICISLCLTPAIFSSPHCKPQLFLLEVVIPLLLFFCHSCRVSFVRRQAGSSMLPAVVHWRILVAIVPVILPVYGAQMTDSAIVSGGAPRAEVFTALNEVGAAAGPVAAVYARFLIWPWCLHPSKLSAHSHDPLAIL